MEKKLLHLDRSPKPIDIKRYRFEKSLAIICLCLHSPKTVKQWDFILFGLVPHRHVTIIVSEFFFLFIISKIYTPASAAHLKLYEYTYLLKLQRKTEHVIPKIFNFFHFTFDKKTTPVHSGNWIAGVESGASSKTQNFSLFEQKR